VVAIYKCHPFYNFLPTSWHCSHCNGYRGGSKPHLWDCNFKE